MFGITDALLTIPSIRNLFFPSMACLTGSYWIIITSLWLFHPPGIMSCFCMDASFLHPLPSFITDYGAGDYFFPLFTGTLTEAFTHHFPLTLSNQVISYFPAFNNDFLFFFHLVQTPNSFQPYLQTPIVLASLKTKVIFVKSLQPCNLASILPWSLESITTVSWVKLLLQPCSELDCKGQQKNGVVQPSEICILMGDWLQCYTTYSITFFRISKFPVSKMILAVPRTFYYTGNR